MFLVLMVENFMVDEGVLILERFKAKITVLTDRRLVLISIMPGETGERTVSFVTELAIIFQTCRRKKNKISTMNGLYFL